MAPTPRQSIVALLVQKVRSSLESVVASPSRWIRYILPSPGSVIFTLLALAGLLWAQSVGALSVPTPAASAPSTSTIAYQGRLADAAGTPLTASTPMVFRLYAAASGGTALWTEQWTTTNSVQVSNGLFNVLLGSLTPLPQSILTANSSLWLGISVGSDAEMAPRVQLGSVPYAMLALTVPDASISATKLSAGSVTTLKLSDNAVTAIKIADGNVTAAKIATNAITAVKIADGSVTTAKIADGAITAAKLSRRMTKVVATNTTPMPVAYTRYTILSLSINLDRETLVTINASAGFENSTNDILFQGYIYVDGVEIIHADNWTKAGIGEQLVLSTSLILPAGSHQILLQGSSWGANGFATGDNRTQLIVIEG